VRQISKVTELPSGFAVIQCVERQPARVPPLEKVKDKVRLAVSRQLARAQAEKEAAALLKRLQKGESLQKVAAAAKVPLKSSGWFTRSQGFLRQPLARSLTTAAFLLTPQKPYPPEPLFWKGQYYILAFKARRSGCFLRPGWPGSVSRLTSKSLNCRPEIWSVRTTDANQRLLLAGQLPGLEVSPKLHLSEETVGSGRGGRFGGPIAAGQPHR